MNKCTTLLHICTHQSSVKSCVRKKKLISPHPPKHPPKHQQRSTSITSHHPTFPPKNWAAFMYSARKVSCAERPPQVEVASLAASVDLWGFCCHGKPWRNPTRTYENLRVKTNREMFARFWNASWNLQSLAVRPGDVVPWGNYSFRTQFLWSSWSPQNHGWFTSPHPKKTTCSRIVLWQFTGEVIAFASGSYERSLGIFFGWIGLGWYFNGFHKTFRLCLY